MAVILKAGDGARRVEFRVGDEFWKNHPEGGIVGGDMVVEVEVRSKGREKVELGVVISGVAVVECDRCLEDCKLPVDWRETVEFEFEGGEIDLEQYIYESAVLSLPVQRAHPDRADCNPEMLGRIAAEE